MNVQGRYSFPSNRITRCADKGGKLKTKTVWSVGMIPDTEMEEAIRCCKLAVRVGSAVVNVTKVQEVEDMIGDRFSVTLVSGVRAFGTKKQHTEVMEKFLAYLSEKSETPRD